MSEIPEDIMRAARSAYDIRDDSMVLTIARTLLAREREVIERCAKIADEYEGGEYDTDDRDYSLASMIATDIRETAR